jgi:hypothetical protein
MKGLLDRARSAATGAVEAARRAPERLVAARQRRANARARAICPVDSWAFTPLYSNGRCPLCGWTPEGYEYAPPLLAPYERYWGALGGMVATSVVMCIVVVIAYARG